MLRRRAAMLVTLTAPSWLAACATPPVSLGDAAAPRAMSLAPGVYMLPGAVGVADEHNLGRIGNAGFIVGETGVLAIDTGTSHDHGQALLGAIRSVTDKPVSLALITHVQPEFLFGATAFRERGIPLVMHERSAGLMTSRCDICLRQLRLTVGEAAMQGTTTFKPDREFAASHRIDSIGRAVRVLYFGHSSGPGDIAILDEHSGVLFAGGLLDHLRIPDIQDADVDGWKRALAALRTLRVSTVVPGHGPATSSELIDTVERYLVQLETRARALAEAGTSLIDVPDATALPEFSRWAQYDSIHLRNATIAYLRFEREAFVK
jgi:glyoxylase-like metal-dependent hydrolase (beta-lactamase superfamily II)